MSPAASACVLAGIAGPVAFTVAWLLSARRQEGYSIAAEHISGLAAADARSPHVMTGGFLVLGACTAAFARGLDDALGGRDRAGLAPRLVRAAGMGVLAAGVLRRDRMLLSPPDAVGQHPSWRNQGHDLASAVVYASAVAAPLALAWRCRGDAEWRALTAPALVTSGVAGGFLILFASRAVEPWNGIVQRVAVTVPGAAMAGLALRLLRRRGGRPPASRGVAVQVGAENLGQSPHGLP